MLSLCVYYDLYVCIQHLCYVGIINRFTCLLESKPVKQVVVTRTVSPNVLHLVHVIQ